MLEHLEAIPGPQREALSTAFGLHAGPAPDRLLVGLAVLSLWSEVAEHSPLLCVIDDAQWADRGSAQALAFVARRMFAESVALVVATREPSDLFTGLPEKVVEGLPDEDARALFASVVRGPVDERARDRFLAETRGNPLALLELPTEVSAAELAVGSGYPLRCRCRAGSKRAFSGDSRHCRKRPGCWWRPRPPSRSAIPPFCGVRLKTSEFAPWRWTLHERRGCSRLAFASVSAIRLSAPPPIRRRHSATGAESTSPWHR